MEDDLIARPVLHAGPDDAGTRVDAFLAKRLGVSRARAQKLLESALVNGQSVKAKTALKEGDEVTVTPSEREEAAPSVSDEELARAPKIEILFEDDDLIVLLKPRGLTVHAGAGETGATLVDILRAQGKALSSVGPTERAGIVHRLDKDTSGLMLVAKTDAAHWKLAADFEARRIQKRYLALVNGVPPARGRIEAPIARSNLNRTKMTVAPGGRMAITEYETQSVWPKFALLNINLLTGRTHQIRVHLLYLHHPIVGDAVYGGLHRALTCAPSERARQAIEALEGQALHAASIEFAHPTTGETMRFEAPPPQVFAEVVAALDDQA